MKVKRVLGLLLSATMISSMLTFPAFAAESTDAATPAENASVTFHDTENHWAAKAIDRWSGYGVIKGDMEGTFRPDANLSRAELATILTSFLSLTETPATNDYADLKGNEWYAAAILKCTAAGIMKGDGAKCNADAAISRQESAVMLARALGIPSSDTADLSAYTDAAQVADWARGYFAAMTKAGIIQGVSAGVLAPNVSISRASVVTILDKAVSEYINKSGEYAPKTDRLTVVTTPDVVLKGGNLAGDLLVAEGVGNGNFTLNNTNVAGNMTVRGGGISSIHIIGTSVVGNITLARQDGAVRVATAGTGSVKAMQVIDGKDHVIVEGTFGNVQVLSDTPVIFKNASVQTVTAMAANTSVTVDKASKVDTVATSSANTTITVAGTVANVAASKEAIGVNLNVGTTGTATTIVSAAPNSTISNDGKVGTLSFSKGATSAKIVVGEKSTMTKIVSEVKSNVTVTTAAAEAAAKAEEAAKAAAKQAAADKLAAEKALAAAQTAEAKAAAEAAQKAAAEAAQKATADAAAAAKASADAKAASDKAAADADKKTEEKPVTPPVREDNGEVTIPGAKPEPPVTPPGGGGGGETPTPTPEETFKTALNTAVTAAIPTAQVALGDIATISLSGKTAGIVIKQPDTPASAVFATDFLAPLLDYTAITKVKIGAQEIVIDRATAASKKASTAKIMRAVATAAGVTLDSSKPTETAIKVLKGKTVSVALFGTTYSDTYAISFT